MLMIARKIKAISPCKVMNIAIMGAITNSELGNLTISEPRKKIALRQINAAIGKKICHISKVIP